MINIELDKSIAMEAGTTFMVHENNCVVGSGTVTLEDAETEVTTDMYVKLTNGLEELEAKE